jgi:hypothetical protein
MALTDESEVGDLEEDGVQLLSEDGPAVVFIFPGRVLENAPSKN